MKNIGTLLIIILFTITVSAQSYYEHRGNFYFDRFNYDKAIEKYILAIEKHPENYNYTIIRKIAESYKLAGNDTASINWYSKLIAANSFNSLDLYNYSIVLKNTEQYSKSSEMLDRYSIRLGEKNKTTNKEFIENIKKNDLLVSVSLIEQSSTESEFSPAYFGDKIIFVSSRQGTGVLKGEYIRNNEAFLQLYIADTLPNGQLDNISLFSNKFNTRFHEGPVFYCEKDNTMYFTRNNYKFFKGFSSDGHIKLKIYQSKFTYNLWTKWFGNILSSIGINTKLNNKGWRAVKECYISNNEYSVGHPTITKDGKKMYFTSNMPEGKGGSDIYVTRRIRKNEWSTPVNLRRLNTAGDEMFPFIHDDGTLYFASNGLPGLGGLDIFKAKSSRLYFKKPENIGAPINSIKDDFGFILNTNHKSGYFSSNRSGGIGSDDLYNVKFKTEVKFLLTGIVTENGSGNPIANANVELIDNENKKIVFITDSNGKYSGNIDIRKKYTLNCNNSLYVTHSSQFNPQLQSVVNGTITRNIELDF